MTTETPKGPDREPDLLDDIRTELLRYPDLPRMTLSRGTVETLLSMAELGRRVPWSIDERALNRMSRGLELIARAECVDHDIEMRCAHCIARAVLAGADL